MDPTPDTHSLLVYILVVPRKKRLKNWFPCTEREGDRVLGGRQWEWFVPKHKKVVLCRLWAELGLLAGAPGIRGPAGSLHLHHLSTHYWEVPLGPRPQLHFLGPLLFWLILEDCHPLFHSAGVSVVAPVPGTVSGEWYFLPTGLEKTTCSVDAATNTSCAPWRCYRSYQAQTITLNLITSPLPLPHVFKLWETPTEHVLRS